MISLLAALLLAAAGSAPAKPVTPVVQLQEPPAPGKPSVRLATREDVARVCAALVPAERLRTSGDAIQRGEAEARHDTDRDAAIRARYEVLVPAAKIAFAPYDGPERRLALMEPASLVAAGGAATLWLTEDRALPVEADAAAARRILDAQKAGALALTLTFDLPDDATCSGGTAGARFVVPAEPVAWRWTTAGVVLARGGEGAERPLLSAAEGARPHVQVGEPIAGPGEVKKLVVAHAPELTACYAEALKRDPALDGVLVADLGGARPVIAADSVGDAELAGCVQRVLGAVAAVRGGGRIAVPIRFELIPPGVPMPSAVASDDPGATAAPAAAPDAAPGVAPVPNASGKRTPASVPGTGARR